MNKGLGRDQCLDIVGLSRNQFYYTEQGTQKGKKPSTTTTWRDPSTQISYEVSNAVVIDQIVSFKLNPDQINWYRMLTKALQIQGYYINHKKVYRLMNKFLLLEKPKKRIGRNFVTFRRVMPEGPLRVIEMDIKYVWVYEMKKYAFILTVIDTFTRYVLHWDVGYTMKSEQVKAVWVYVIANYLQPAGMLERNIQIEVRNDNGKQFSSDLVIDFFENNRLMQVFTHPYTPEENGHVESFHAILAKAIKADRFTSLAMVESRLEKFYARYNNDRSHSGTIGIPPAKFWALYEDDKIKVIPLDKRRVKYKLKVAYQDILTISSIDNYKYPIVSATG